MKKLYYDSAYIRTFEAKVLSCTDGKKGYEVVLDQTAFFPEGGGQPYDTGVLGGVPVTAVHEKNGEIIHYTDAPLTVGETVTGEIDWERRFRNMQGHSGEHLVSGLIHAKYGYDNVGFHMGSEEITIDLNGLLEWEELLEIEKRSSGRTVRSMRDFRPQRNWKRSIIGAKRNFPERSASSGFRAGTPARAVERM